MLTKKKRQSPTLTDKVIYVIKFRTSLCSQGRRFWSHYS